MKKILNRTSAIGLCMSLILAACGGGGGGGGGGGTTPIATTPTSYWTLDNITYVNGATSHQSTALAGGVPLTVSVMSSSATTGAGATTANSGSVLTPRLVGTTAGTYTVIPTAIALTDGSMPGQYLYLEVQIGTGVTTGSTVYSGTSGNFSITVDSGGKLHYTTTVPVTVVKKLDVLGGVIGAPASMVLNVVDAS